MCPEESGTAPSGLHLYEGQSGLVSGGSPTTINGLQAFVALDTSSVTMTVTFPGVGQWMTISAAPAARTRSDEIQQVALERQIVATVEVAPGGDGAP